MKYLYSDAVKENEKRLIGNNLRKLREGLGISAKEIPELLKTKGFEIKYSTYMGYENNNSIPNADVFLALCDIFCVHDVLRSFGYGNSIFPSFDSSALFAVPYFNLIEDFCESRTVDSKAVFDYFFDPIKKSSLDCIFREGKPRKSDEVAVAKILNMNSHEEIYRWGERKGIWDPSLSFAQLSDDEKDFLLAYRQKKKERANSISSAG